MKATRTLDLFNFVFLVHYYCPIQKCGAALSLSCSAPGAPGDLPAAAEAKATEATALMWCEAC